MEKLIDIMFGIIKYNAHYNFWQSFPIILNAVTEIAIPIAAILLIVWLIRHWKK